MSSNHGWLSMDRPPILEITSPRDHEPDVITAMESAPLPSAGPRVHERELQPTEEETTNDESPPVKGAGKQPPQQDEDDQAAEQEKEQRSDREQATIDDESPPLDSTTGANNKQPQQRDEDEHEEDGDGEEQTVTVCGYPIHLSFVRTYNAPLDDWNMRSFEMYYGLMYKDPDVADQFRAFYCRSCLSITMGTVYALAYILAATTLVLYKAHAAVSTAAVVVLLVMMLVDLAIHLFAPQVTPDIAKVRMMAAFVIAAVPMLSDGWAQFSDLSNCDKSWQLPYFSGRIDYSSDRQRQLCVRIFDPYGVASITMASLGVTLYPIPHAFLAVLHFVLYGLVSPHVVTGPFGHREPSETAVKMALLLVCEIGAMAMTYVRFSAGRSAFEATIKIEMQRREASARATELHQLLNTIVPEAVLPRLEAGGAGQFSIDNVPCASMLFADMKGFTAWSSSRSAEAVTSMLNTVVADLDALATLTDTVEKIKTVGDAYWAVSGIPVEAENHADQLILFGWRMNQRVAELNVGHAEWGGVMWRVGIHTGPMTGALFGERQVSYEVFGETASIAQVVEAKGIGGSVVCTEQTVAALLERPDRKNIRAHEVFDGLGPAGGVLTLYEMLEPHDDTDSSRPRHSARRAIPADNSQHTDNKSLRVPTAALSPSGHSIIPMLPGAASSVSTAGVSGGRSHKYISGRSPVLSSRTTAKIAAHELAHGRADPDRCVTIGATKQAQLESAQQENNGENSELDLAFDGAAFEALAKTSFPILPYFADPHTEDLFKARSEVACRNMNRVCTVMMFLTHLVYMSSLFAFPEPCFAVVGVTLQGIAVIPYVAAIVLALHPTLSLRISITCQITAVFVGIVGTALTSLNGCNAGHDMQAYAFMSFVTLLLAAGPVSWPQLFLATLVFVTPPAVIFAVFFSPIAVAAIAYVPIASAMAATVAFFEERLLRHRFIEEELSKRGQAQLASLGEQRVAVLQRLVPGHVVADLIEWFGTKMDPDRSITRSYARVIIAFMKLRPDAIEMLPKLHAEVDTDLLDLHGTCAQDDSHGGDAIASTPGNITNVSILDKIKTVGDLVMVAGPFPTRDDDGTASAGSAAAICATDADVLASFNAIVGLFTKVRAKCAVQVGAHIGPVVGTVQGSSRLAFDVFGDPVNVASRVLSGAGSARGSSMHVSGTLASFVEEKGANASHRPTSFGPATAATAKGKGVLEIRSVMVTTSK